MKLLSLIFVSFLIHASANADMYITLVPVGDVTPPVAVPTIDLVAQSIDKGTIPGEIPLDSVDLKLWRLKYEPEGIDGEMAGQLFLGLQHNYEGSPTDVYQLPIDGVIEIKSVEYQSGTIAIEVAKDKWQFVNATTSILVEVEVIDSQDPEPYSTRTFNLDLKYTPYGEIDQIIYRVGVY
jgi:hypothetical protein